MNYRKLYQIDIDPFNAPLMHYMRFRMKMKHYEDIKSQSSVKYYGHIGKKVIMYYVRPRLVSAFINMLLFMFALHFAEESGFVEYVWDKKDKLYDWIYGIYNVLFGLK
jgi:hypothetical protein